MIGSVALGGFVGGFVVVSAARAPRAVLTPSVERIAFERLVASNTMTPIDPTLDAPLDAVASRGVAAVVYAKGSAIAFVDPRTGKARAILGLPNDSTRSPLAVAGADSNRLAILDGKRGTVDVVNSRGRRLSSVMLPRGVWSSVVWDSNRQHVLVTGLELDGPRSASDGRSIHEFDAQGNEVGAHREVAPIKHRLQASFNMPFAAVDGSKILSGSNLSNEVLIFDRASATERVVRVADGWFQPIDWTLPRQTVPAKSVAEPTMSWLASQTMLTAVIPLSRGQFIARFTQHAFSREQYVYALVDSAGRTRALTQPTTVKLSSASGDTVSGMDGTARLFAGVLSQPR